MKKTHLFLLFFAGAVMISCNDKQELVDGWKPVYSSESSTSEVAIKASEPLENPGRIYTYENLLLVNDQAKGIHIYDNTVKSNPTELSFIGIEGNMDFSVKANKIYADNITDMVIIDISNPSSPVYSNRLEDVFPIQQFPDEFGAFECVDASKGNVVGWEKAKLENPKCFR
jgi:LVIVD repeat